MKRIAAVLLLVCLMVSGVALTNNSAFINTGVAEVITDTSYYNQNDVVLMVYTVTCDNDVGGITMEVNYDGDNFDFAGAYVSNNGSYETMFNDNGVGRVMITAADRSGYDFKRTVKLAVGFKALYMLDSSFVSFSENIIKFVDGGCCLSDSYTIERQQYVYDVLSGESYKNYVKGLLQIDGDDASNTDTDITIDTDSDTATDTETDTDTDIIIGTDSDTDTETDTDTDIIIGTDSDTDTETDTIKSFYAYGDADLDGEITAADALYILRCSVELESPSSEIFVLCDIDTDNTISAVDSLYVLRYSVGLADDNNAGKESYITMSD